MQELPKACANLSIIENIARTKVIHYAPLAGKRAATQIDRSQCRSAPAFAGKGDFDGSSSTRRAVGRATPSRRAQPLPAVRAVDRAGPCAPDRGQAAGATR